MSTEHQRYSPASQAEAIAAYAKGRGISVVRTYADHGRSGLTLAGRLGLTALLEDVASGRADFELVLVYDVSRWGRFQDCDEAAHYEHLCRRGGVRVEYCAEPFTNEGSPMAMVLKALKRVMAAEYSRELSEKVFAGKTRAARMGFRPGGAAGFGLRRMLVDPRGNPLRVLGHGERKCTAGDRIVLVPGLAAERRVLAWIFRQVAERGATIRSLVERLNARGVEPEPGARWTSNRVAGLLANEKYVGNLVCNRTVSRLRSPSRPNPPERWARVDGAFPPAVDPALFRRAQRALARRPCQITEPEAVECLRKALALLGRLTQRLIDSVPGIPGSSYYAKHFGGLGAAYALVGAVPAHGPRDVEALRARRGRSGEVTARLAGWLGACGVEAARAGPKVVSTAAGLRTEVLVVGPTAHGAGPRWMVQTQLEPASHLVLAVCTDALQGGADEFWLLRGGPTQVILGDLPGRRRHVLMRSGSLERVMDRLAELAALPTPPTPARPWARKRRWPPGRDAGGGGGNGFVTF
jgi:DNA invertase Pin-like site-specific DNA recombinase